MGLAVGLLVVINIVITAILLGKPVPAPQACTPAVGGGGGGGGEGSVAPQTGGGAGTYAYRGKTQL